MLERRTYLFEAISSLNAIMYITRNNYVHHVHEIQDPHFGEKPKFEKWNF